MLHQPFHAGDAVAVRQLFTDVFVDSEGEAEGQMIGDLVSNLIATTDSQALYGFVTQEQGELVAAIFFSRLQLASGQSGFILSPVAVATAHQGKGLGQSLITYGIETLRQQGVHYLLTYGDPAFYSKVGFLPLSEQVIPAPFTLSHPQGWLGQALCVDEIKPEPQPCQCVHALNDSKYW